MSDDKKAPVWIRCRATEGCDGNQADIVFTQKQQPVKAKTGVVGGTFTLAEGAGKIIRYRCTTCNKVFHIGQ